MALARRHNLSLAQVRCQVELALQAQRLADQDGADPSLSAARRQDQASQEQRMPDQAGKNQALPEPPAPDEQAGGNQP